MDDSVIKSKWKDEEHLDEFRFQDFSHVLFKNNESFYKEYLKNYRKVNNISSVVKDNDEENNDKAKKNTSTICTVS